MVKQICLFLIKVVQSADGEDGKKEGEFGRLWTKAAWMKEGEMVMEQIEICGEIEVDRGQ